MNYEEKLAEAKRLYKTANVDQRYVLESLFPELVEREDERMKKAIMHVLYENYTDAAVIEGVEIAEIIAWLEKQCEPADKVEPKFKEGDFIVPDNITSLEIWKVINIDDDGYYNIQPITNIINTEDDEIYRVPGFIIEKDYRLWTIQDAKDGDVLVNGSNIFIFHFLNGTRLMGYCHVNIDDGRFYDDIGKNECFCLIDAEVTPATKEQRELLFQKMADAGYEWNAEKKELKKIEPKTLNADEVIEWMEEHVPTKFEDMQNYVEKFKKDFGL